MERSANPAEAAAIVAAVERFIAETAPREEPVDAVSPWTRAALLEGVSAKRTIKDLEGGMR
jgi:hypothetical protein